MNHRTSEVAETWWGPVIQSMSLDFEIRKTAQRVEEAKRGWGRGGGSGTPLCLPAQCSLYCYALSLSTKQTSHSSADRKIKELDVKTTANTYLEPTRYPSQSSDCTISFNTCDKPTRVGVMTLSHSHVRRQKLGTLNGSRQTPLQMTEDRAPSWGTFSPVAAHTAPVRPRAGAAMCFWTI